MRRMRFTLVVCTIGWLAVGVAGAQPQSDAEAASVVATARYLIVRYDDYAPRVVAPEAHHGIELERRLFDLFDQYDVKLVVGVIPEPVSGDIDGHDPYVADADWLSRSEDPWVALLRKYVELGVVEPALHGYQHKRHTPPGHRPGEFVAQPYEWQHDALKRGRARVAAAVDRSVDVFVPPWNAWDTITAKALSGLGFHWLSPDLHHADLPDCAIKVAPQTAADPTEARELVGRERPLPAGSVVVLVIHPFSISSESDFYELETLLVAVRDSPTWQCVGFAGLPPAPSDEWQRRFRATVTGVNTTQKIEDMIGGRFWIDAAPVVLLPLAVAEARASSTTLRLYACGAVAGAISALIGWACAGIVARWKSGPVALSAAGALATVVLVIGAVLIIHSGYHVRGIRLQAILAGVGATMGARVVVARSRRTRRRRSSGDVPKDQNTGTMVAP